MYTQKQAGLHEHRFRKKTQLNVLLSIFKHEKKNFTISLLLLTIKHSPALCLPIIIGNVINAIIKGGESAIPSIINNTIFISLLFLQNILTHTLFVKYLSKANRSIEKSLRFSLIKRMQELSISFHDSFESGRLQSKILRDVESIEMLLRQIVNVIFTGVLNIIFAMVATLKHNYIVALFYVVTVPLSSVLIKIFHKKIAERNKEFRSQIENMSARVNEMVQMIPITRAHGLEEIEISEMGRHLDNVRQKGEKLDVLNAIFGSSAWVTYQSFQFVCLLVTGLMAYKGIIMIGDVVMYQGFFGMIINSVNMIINIFPEINKGFDSLKSLGEILECPDIEDNKGKNKVTIVKGGFRFDNVSFCYTPDKEVITNFNLDVKPGECIALVGESGAGKSTLMGLLIGYRRPVKGKIFLDGVNMNDLDLRTYRRYLSVVPQNVVLFSGSIRDNILYGLDKETVDEQSFNKVIDMARVREFADKLPQGIDTKIGEHGSKLSGGQRQRIAIARALIRDPKVIIFDEATSALDVESEQHIQEAISELIKNRTTFIIAHRLTTIRKAHRIVVIENGKIAEIGTHSQLIENQGIYYRMHYLSNNID